MIKVTVDFFIKAYDFNDFIIKNAILKDGFLEIYVTINAHLDLIANGYRPSLDLDYDTVFSFMVNEKSDIITDFNNFNCYLDNNDCYVAIGNKKYKLISNEIIVKN